MIDKRGWRESERPAKGASADEVESYRRRCEVRGWVALIRRHGSGWWATQRRTIERIRGREEAGRLFRDVAAEVQRLKSKRGAAGRR